MKRNLNIINLNRMALAIALSIIIVPDVVAEDSGAPDALERQAFIQQSQQHQQKLQSILNDKAGYVAVIVQKWEDSARASGRWDQNYTNDLSGALMNLQPENLLAAGEAPSYEAMREVLATGRVSQAVAPGTLGSATNESLNEALGYFSSDLVYTPVAPCRIVDTRLGGGQINAGSTRSFDVDGTNFSAQGGKSSSCGIPFDVAAAVAMNITTTQPAAAGFFTAWEANRLQPNASVFNYGNNETVANTSIIPVTPGSGADFQIYSTARTHAVVDVLGYFAAPEATALDCTTAYSEMKKAVANQWTDFDATCPAGRTATGGGGVNAMSSGDTIATRPLDNGIRIQLYTSYPYNAYSYVRCCRMSGR